MAHAYTPADVTLAESFILQFYGASPQPMNQAGIDGFSVPFQFPPKIINDSRKGHWDDQETRGTEPIATYITSGAREITLTTTYIVDGGFWSVNRISNIIKTLRGYFTRIRADVVGAQIGDHNMIVLLKMWAIGGKELMTGRIRGVDVKHSDTIVVACENSDNIGFGDSGNDINPATAFPLRSDVTIDLRLWTQGGPIAVVQDIFGLKEAEVPDWY